MNINIKRGSRQSKHAENVKSKKSLDKKRLASNTPGTFSVVSEKNSTKKTNEKHNLSNTDLPSVKYSLNAGHTNKSPTSNTGEGLEKRSTKTVKTTIVSENVDKTHQKCKDRSELTSHQQKQAEIHRKNRRCLRDLIYNCNSANKRNNSHKVVSKLSVDMLE